MTYIIQYQLGSCWYLWQRHASGAFAEDTLRDLQRSYPRGWRLIAGQA